MNFNTTQKLLISILLIGLQNAQADTAYQFTSAPISLERGHDDATGDNTVLTNNFVPNPITPGVPFLLNGMSAVGNTLSSASLTFANALAPNSTTQIHDESGGFSLFGAITGGLTAYSSSFGGITSNLNLYQVGAGANDILYSDYTTLDGSVKTDSNGKIVDWNLNFQEYTPQGGIGFFDLNTSTNTLTLGVTDNPTSLMLSGSQGPTIPINISKIVDLNGYIQNPPIQNNYSGHDFGTLDFGLGPEDAYTASAGSFSSTQTVSEPSSLLLMLATLLSWKVIALFARKWDKWTDTNVSP